MKKRTVAALIIAALWSRQSLAQSGAPSDTELSKEAENPVNHQLSFRGRMGARLVAEYHGELDRERGQVDRSAWRRLQ
jgi:hypothetical protein